MQERPVGALLAFLATANCSRDCRENNRRPGQLPFLYLPSHTKNLLFVLERSEMSSTSRGKATGLVRNQRSIGTIRLANLHQDVAAQFGGRNDWMCRRMWHRRPFLQLSDASHVPVCHPHPERISMPAGFFDLLSQARNCPVS